MRAELPSLRAGPAESAPLERLRRSESKPLKKGLRASMPCDSFGLGGLSLRRALGRGRRPPARRPWRSSPPRSARRPWRPGPPPPLLRSSVAPPAGGAAPRFGWARVARRSVHPGPPSPSLGAVGSSRAPHARGAPGPVALRLARGVPPPGLRRAAWPLPRSPWCPGEVGVLSRCCCFRHLQLRELCRP